MNIAIILAGGTGQRLGANIPKQFVAVLGKPLIVYTLEIYQQSPHFDAIEVVCAPGYIDDVWSYVAEYQLTKVRWVVEGGGSCQDSTRNGIFSLEGVCGDDDIIMLAMSTSIFVSEDIIEDSLRVCREYGNAFACMQCIYNLAETADGLHSTNIHFKESHKTLNLPWSAPFHTFDRLYRRAYAEGVETSSASYAPTLFLALGEVLHLSKDTPLNKLHVTTTDDLEIVTAVLERQQRQ